MTEHRVERLGIEGDGLAAGVRIPFSLPGEVWSGEPDADGRLADGVLVTPSDVRVKARCRHFGSCGGCSLQHADDGFLAEWKADVVRRALGAHGLETEIRPTLSSPPASRRRAVFTGVRTRKTATTGFHERRSDTVVAVPDCQVLRPEIMEALPVLDGLTRMAATRTRGVRMSVLLSPAGLDVSVEDARELDVDLRARLGTFAGGPVARLVWNGEPVWQERAPFQEFGAARVVPPPGGFLQATAEGEAALVEAVLDIAGDAKRVVDLFSGCGTFSLPLAARAEVHAVEGLKASIQALDAGWRGATGLKRVTTEVRDLFRRPLLEAELEGLDVAVVDPPRAGAQAQVERIAASKLGRVAMVSCDPVSFARDAKTLVDAGFEIRWVQPVDQFIWTGHVEMVAEFVR